MGPARRIERETPRREVVEERVERREAKGGGERAEPKSSERAEAKASERAIAEREAADRHRVRIDRSPVIELKTLVGAAPARAELPPPAAVGPKARDLYDAGYWQKLEAIAGEPARAATDVEVLRNGEHAWERRIHFGDDVERSLVHLGYVIEPNAKGIAYLRELAAVARRGKTVIVGIDWLAQRLLLAGARPEARRAFAAATRELLAAGGRLAEYAAGARQLEELGVGNHFKALIKDGRAAIVGCRNVGDSHYDHWSDFELRLEGPIVASVGRAALSVLRDSAPSLAHLPKRDRPSASAAWRAKLDVLEADYRGREVTLQADAKARRARGERLAEFVFVFANPLRDKPPPGGLRGPSQALIETFGRVQRSLLATSNYVNGHPAVMQPVTAAALRGAEVMLVTTGREASDYSDLPWRNARRGYATLLDAGARIAETKIWEHSKIYVADGRVAGFGSYNLERPAESKLAEGLFFTREPALVQAMRDAVHDTIDRRSVVLDGVPPLHPSSAGLGRRIVEQAREIVARLIEPFQ